ncbi:MAG: Flp family type IVb pilin [Candidatus Riflebacteria bacterium]|nr:Flp family type IVb pilin [Candidatus Riflebacteria bacterium]
MLKRIKNLFVRRDEEGQGLVEYGLILGLIAVVAIAALNATGGSVNTLIQKVASSLTTVS